MTTFTLDTDNNVTAHDAAPAAVGGGGITSVTYCHVAADPKTKDV